MSSDDDFVIDDEEDDFLDPTDPDDAIRVRNMRFKTNCFMVFF